MTHTSSKPHIFITGGSGYIGGTFLHLMLSSGCLREFVISALVRHPNDAQKMLELGVRPVLGTLDDDELLKNESAQAIAVFNMANCDHEDSASAIIRGLSESSKQTGLRPILIHMSGAGVLSTTSKGIGLSPDEDIEAKLWDDTNFAAHAVIPPHAPHRHVDLEIFAAGRTGFVKTYLVVPPTVFGRGVGTFAESRMSIQIPRLVGHSLMNQRTMFVGSGANQWTNVHVLDLADLCIRIFEAAMKDTAPEGDKGIYYPASEFFVWSEVSHRIAQLLHGWRLIKSPIATTGLQRGWFWGSNVRMTCENGRKLGWVPVRGGTQAMLDAVEWDATLVLGAQK